jgi:hypothetical protein
MTISPNPATDDVTITIAANERGSYVVELVSADGSRLEEHPLGTLHVGLAYHYTLDLGRYASGLYWVRLWTPSGVRTTPLVRIR